MIKILVGDDHAIVRAGLKEIIRDNKDMLVADEACSGREVLSKVSSNDYDVVVLDITLPDVSGLDVLKQIKRDAPKLPVLMLSIHPEEQYAVRALRAGASGYLTKESAPEELVEAIEKAAMGRRYVSSSLAEKFALDLVDGSEKPFHEELSDREFQVLCMIAKGKPLKDIGDSLGLSTKTISTYRSRVLEKMRMESNAELTRYALENHLVA
jgi:DNA-binding NarL/FixJ family response regulator